MVLGGLATVIAVITSPIGLITAGLIAGTAAWFKYTDSGQNALKVLGEIVGDITGALSDAKAEKEAADAGKGTSGAPGAGPGVEIPKIPSFGYSGDSISGSFSVGALMAMAQGAGGGRPEAETARNTARIAKASEQ